MPEPPASGDPFADLIEPFSRRGVDLGLGRLGAALAELGHPERRFAAVQVAGTNGKGSICTLVHRALLASGLRAGLYTSPHLVCWSERILIGAGPISVANLRRQLERATPAGASQPWPPPAPSAPPTSMPPSTMPPQIWPQPSASTEPARHH